MRMSFSLNVCAARAVIAHLVGAPDIGNLDVFVAVSDFKQNFADAANWL